MEGLRLLPWIHEAERRKDWDLQNCDDCMAHTSEQVRQTMGCGYAPVPTGPLARMVNIPVPTSGCRVSVTVCPGYSTRLPETIEAARARLHWSKGGPSSIGIRDWADSPLALGIEILEGASNEAQAWAMENPPKKAGA